MIDYMNEFMEYQKAFMEVISEIRSQNMMTFPVLTYSLLKKDGIFINEDFAKWCCKQNMKWADSNFFISDDVTSLSNCCRLVSDIKNLGFMNSIGGTALEVGSIKVNTINLARLSYESTKKSYLENLKKAAILCVETLDVIRGIIQRNIEKGLLPNYSKNVISIKNQYNTIGIIGIFETLEEYGLINKDSFGNSYYSEEGLEFANEIFDTIIEIKEKFTEDKDYQINIEQVPKKSGHIVK